MARYPPAATGRKAAQAADTVAQGYGGREDVGCHQGGQAGLAHVPPGDGQGGDHGRKSDVRRKRNSFHDRGETCRSGPARIGGDIGLSEDDLRCDRKLKAAHNCSGNHTGMLAACVYHGWDVATYQRADHLAQVAGIESVAEATGIAAADMPCGVCSSCAESLASNCKP